MRFLEFLLIVQIFYAFAITLIAHSIPEGHLVYITEYRDAATDSESISDQLTSITQQQTQIPVVDLGALVFYSGNLIIDFMLNFLTAIPQMFGLILNVFLNYTKMDAFQQAQFLLFFQIILTVSYILGVIRFILNIRARGAVV